MNPLPDDALVVRGGQNLPENFAKGSGVKVGSGGKLAWADSTGGNCFFSPNDPDPKSPPLNGVRS